MEHAVAAKRTMKRLIKSALNVIARPLLRIRAQRMAAIIGRHLQPGDRVLDVGCGDLSIGNEIVRRSNVSWVGVDTIDYHGSDLEFHVYDGKTLPFKSGEFPVVILAFVLHHCADVDAVVREAARTSNRKIIVLEDIVDGGFLSITMTRCHDYLVNRFISARIPLPYQFKTSEKWTEIFRAHGFRKIAGEKMRTHPLAFVNQMIFILERENG